MTEALNLSPKIQDLEDFPAIQQIGNALWKKGDVQGAALMVGSGFSRLASLNDISSPLPPLWGDFSAKMESQLYPSGKAPSDPLRLAQEYKAALGAPALDGLVQSLIRDDQWEPSELHRTILGLPWADVLTTNWDTLLERTPLLETERTYDIVRTVADIPRTRAPRIVKLHGSFPANRPFIFTEDDFRTYPSKFAPFVNLAQQVLLENELCLFGFSGDDPNFLQWSGWVRDNLGDSARQIRLIGVLNISPSRREMLKQHNVTAIDLAPLVHDVPNDTKHAIAIEKFLEWLVTSKPDDAHIWKRTSQETLPRQSTTDSVKPTVKEIAKSWKEDRLSYPGWLVTSGGTQHMLRFETDRHYPSLVRMPDSVTDSEKMDLAFELACRHELSFWPMNSQNAKSIEDIYEKCGENHFLAQDNLRLCGFMYAEARRRSDWISFEYWGKKLEKVEHKNASAELLYGQALRAKHEFDFDKIEALTSKISGDDPVWKMRQGMLYTVIYEDAKAAECYRSALENIRHRRTKDKQSIWLLSREAWANWIFRSAWAELPENEGEYVGNFGDWPTHYAQKKCDPWDYMSFVDRELAEEIEKSQDLEIETPLFDAGHYRNNSGGMRFSSHANVSAHAGPVAV